MQYISYISQVLTLIVIGAVSFSVTHAKDVTAVASLSSSKTLSSLQVQTVKTLDNGIHLDAHTHIERQTLTSLLDTNLRDQPAADRRSMKRFITHEERRALKYYDGILGMHVPSTV